LPISFLASLDLNWSAVSDYHLANNKDQKPQFFQGWGFVLHLFLTTYIKIKQQN